VLAAPFGVALFREEARVVVVVGRLVGLERQRAFEVDPGVFRPSPGLGLTRIFICICLVGVIY
jgi:hypothetical protein